MMNYPQDVFLEDMQAVLKASEAEDFAKLNIYANRIMSNALFGEDYKLAIPGVFVKDLSFSVNFLKFTVSVKALSSAMVLFKKYIVDLVQQTGKRPLDEEVLWRDYVSVVSKLREFQLDTLEEKVYVKDYIPFVRGSFQWLGSYVRDHESVLLHPKNLLLKATLNEMNRLYRDYGGEIEEVQSLELFTALDRANDYLRVIANSEEEYANKAKQELIPSVLKVLPLVGQQAKASGVNEVLWQITKQWREYFLQFMELQKIAVWPVIESRQGIQLPEETKKKLTEAITESLQEKPRPKKGK